MSKKMASNPAAAKNPKAKKNVAATEKKVAPEGPAGVDSVHAAPMGANDGNQAEQPPAPNKEKKPVTLTLKSLDKRGRNAIYTGAAVSIRIPVAAFPNKSAVPTLEVGDGLAGPKEKKPQMTAEERKAARAAQPKLTLAEKVARAEERAQKLREKLAAAAAQPAEAVPA